MASSSWFSLLKPDSPKKMNREAGERENLPCVEQDGSPKCLQSKALSGNWLGSPLSQDEGHLELSSSMLFLSWRPQSCFSQLCGPPQAPGLRHLEPATSSRGPVFLFLLPLSTG